MNATISRSTMSIDDYVETVIADAPPISASTAMRVMDMLNAVQPKPAMSAKQNRAALNDARRRAERAEASRRERAATACAVCGVPKAGHHYNDSYHAWESKK